MYTVFISYSHKDTKWRDLITNHLKVLELNKELQLEVWSDTQLEEGGDWRAMIEEKLESAAVAILIISTNFLASPFIRTKELPYLLERRNVHNLVVLVVLAEPCAWETVRELDRIQFSVSRALLGRPDHEVANDLSELVREVRRRLTPKPSVEDQPTEFKPPPVKDVGATLSTLELSLRHYRGTTYQAELSYSSPRSPKDDRALRPYKVDINPAEFDRLVEDAPTYAQKLATLVFPEGPPRTLIERVRDDLRSGFVRLRVSVEPNAQDMHGVYWETLPLVYSRDPFAEAGGFSVVRFAAACGEGWPAPRVSSRPQFDICLYALAPSAGEAIKPLLVDYEKEFSGAGASCIALPVGTTLQPLARLEVPIVVLIVELREDGAEPTVLIHDDAGRLIACAADQFAALIRDLPVRPQVLVVDCFESGNGKPAVKALLMLASELIATGVCAVITRQAQMLDPLWHSFLTSFVAELSKSSNVERATRFGRSHVGYKEDAWKVVLFTRLRTGQIWYTPNFLDANEPTWDLLIERIKSGLCVPVIGYALNDYLFRSRGDIAERWADKFRYPVCPADRRELRKVAQYVATSSEPWRVRKEFEDSIREYALERYADALRDIDQDTSIDELVQHVWRSVFSQRKDDSYRILARLRAKVYLTTHYHRFLSLAIADRQTGRDGESNPRAGRVRERIFAEDERILGEEEDIDDRTMKLDRNAPLVYHLFGRTDRSSTLVLTEDDHFRFLLQFPRKWQRLPELVRTHISDSVLLFAGFDLDSWEFRSVFRAILELAGSESFRRNAHVAVQIEPNDASIRDPDRTLRYLVDYFGQISHKPHVFLGSAQDFLRELDHQLTQAGMP